VQRKTARARASGRKRLPPCDLGGAVDLPPVDPELLARPARELGPFATRASPIRDRIMAFLSRPRAAADIAAHIHRPLPVATGHLAAMRRRGLVQRIGRATYALASYRGLPLDLGARPSCSDRKVRQKLRALLVMPRPFGELIALTQEPQGMVLAALRDLWRLGWVTGDSQSGYQLVSAYRAQ
jgi:hypothetical protein